MSFFSRGSNKGGNRGRRGQGPNTFWHLGDHKKLRFSIHFDVDFDEFQQLIQTCHLNLGSQQALPQPHAAKNVILHPHPGIVNILESHVQPNIDGWGNLSSNPSSGANKWPMPPPPPHVYTIVATASIFYLQFIQCYLSTWLLHMNPSLHLLHQRIIIPHHIAPILTKDCAMLVEGIHPFN